MALATSLSYSSDWLEQDHQAELEVRSPATARRGVSYCLLPFWFRLSLDAFRLRMLDLQ